MAEQESLIELCERVQQGFVDVSKTISESFAKLNQALRGLEKSFDEGEVTA